MWRPDDVWRRQTDRVREMLRRDFDTVWLLSDSTDASRVLAAGFDGGAPYAAFSPQQCPQLARAFSGLNLTFSPSIGTGFDTIVERNVPADSCYRPPPFEPPATIDWSSASDRERAARLSLWQIEMSMRTSLNVQTNSTLRNASTGFFIVYIATFNKWHEGTCRADEGLRRAFTAGVALRLSQCCEWTVSAQLPEGATGADHSGMIFQYSTRNVGVWRGILRPGGDKSSRA